MNPAKVNRAKVECLLDLPNVGPATVKDLHLLGIRKPHELVGMDPFEMHKRLCKLTKTKQDPCVIDVFLSIVAFANGGPPKVWWEFTAERKRCLSGLDASKRTSK